MTNAKISAMRELTQRDGRTARVWLAKHSRWVVERIEFDVDGIPDLESPDDGSYASEKEALEVAQRIVNNIGG